MSDHAHVLIRVQVGLNTSIRNIRDVDAILEQKTSATTRTAAPRAMNKLIARWRNLLANSRVFKGKPGLS